MRSMMLRSHERALDRMMERMGRMFPEYPNHLSIIDEIFDTLEKRVDSDDVNVYRYKKVPQVKKTCSECGHVTWVDAPEDAETADA